MHVTQLEEEKNDLMNQSKIDSYLTESKLVSLKLVLCYILSYKIDTLYNC